MYDKRTLLVIDTNLKVELAKKNTVNKRERDKKITQLDAHFLIKRKNKQENKFIDSMKVLIK